MATVVSITNPITGAVEQVDKLDHTAQQIDDAVALFPQLSNPNLLDNWYFGNPVNQRGQTEHTGSQNGYFIDRWILGSYDQTVTVTESGLHWSTAEGIWCTQVLENFDELIGKTLTLSAIIDGVLYSVTGVLNESGNVSMRPVGTMFVELTHADKGFRFVTYNNPTPTVTILAVKLELGSQQTLAHQDADGNWVLNEIPDYGEQLLRCQRHMLRIGYTDGSTYAPTIAHGIATASTIVRFFIPTPVAMRISPALKYSTSISSLRAIGAGQSLSISSFTAVRAESNGILLIASVTGATTNEAYSLYLTDASGLLLDANL